MEARPRSKFRLIDFSKEPLGWPGDDDEELIDINTLRSMSKMALDIIQGPPTSTISFAPEDLNLISSERDVQMNDLSSSIPPISNDGGFTYTDLEALLKADLERISTSSTTPSSDSCGTAYASGGYMFPNPHNQIILNESGHSLGFNIPSIVAHHPVDDNQGHTQNPVMATVNLTSHIKSNGKFYIEPSQMDPIASASESLQAVPLFPALLEPYQPLPPGGEFVTGDLSQCGSEVSVFGPRTVPDSFPHTFSQMTAENIYPTSLFGNNPTFPPLNSNDTTYGSISYNEQGLSSAGFSLECHTNPSISLNGQLGIPMGMDMLNLGNPGSPEESTQQVPDISQPTLDKEKFVYDHWLIKPILARNTSSRNGASINSGSTPTRPNSANRLLQGDFGENVLTERLVQRQEKGEQKAVEPPVHERSNSINRRQALKPYFRPIRAKSPGMSTSSPINLTAVSPATSPSPTPISEASTRFSGIDERSTSTSWSLVGISFNTLVRSRTAESEATWINPGVAFSELKQLNFGLRPVSEILENPESRPLVGLPTMKELFVFVEWPIHLEREKRQKHKVAKLDRPINHFSRVEILCKIAKRLYEYIQKEQEIPLDPKKLCIMSLRQQINSTEWTVKLTIKSQH
ncbi:hypothetical protein Clacol_001057 [Clathrus columnatus]|uniref:Uncharacterized protein n=1 Tax=Clathrus columnatus TaxID=1419009 RepID=A0AAV5A2S3_9AGAM|nr:hypothetical protein Clacol_001057 [Clathrus columnatus]